MELCLVTDHACNLRCTYCYTGQKASRPMSVSTAKRAIDLALARDSAGLELSFFGGEPLLQFDLVVQATNYAEQRLAGLGVTTKPYIHLNTNATLVDDRVATFVRSHLPMNAFVSLDGPAFVHDRHRLDAARTGSHARVRSGIQRLLDAGATVIPVAVVNPDTAEFLGDVAVELFGLPISRAHITCNLRADWDDTALEGLRRGLHDAARVWGDAFRAGRAVQFEPLTNKVLSHLHGAMPCARRCQLAARELVVAPSGRIYPCGELVGEDENQRFVVGDLEHGLDMPKLQLLRQAKERIEVTCESCAIRERCSSSCGCKHVALTGNYGEITDTLCETEAALIDAADSIAERLHAEGCEPFLRYFYDQRWTVHEQIGMVRLRRNAADA